MDPLELLKLSWNEIEASLSKLSKPQLLTLHSILTREHAIQHNLFIEWVEFKTYLHSELRKHGIVFPSVGSAY